MEPALVNVSCSPGVVMPICTTLSPKVKYFYKSTHEYYLIVVIEQLGQIFLQPPYYLDMNKIFIILPLDSGSI